MDILRSALSMVIHKKGDVTEWDVDDLIYRYGAKKGIHIEKEKYWQAVRIATEMFNKQDPCLYMCTDSRCLDKAFLNPAKAAVDTLSKELECPIKLTGCHWECDDAPVLTLRVGNESYRFDHVSSEESWARTRQSLKASMLRSACK